MSLREFIRGPNGSCDDPVKEYILHGGWAPSTLKHYNAGVSKLMDFAETFNIPRSSLLPINPQLLFQFVVWVGPNLPGKLEDGDHCAIKSGTIRTYLSGIKAWHLYHYVEYPHSATKRVELLLTSARKIELRVAPKVPKEPVMIRHLFYLLDDLTGKTLEDQTVYTVALVAVWGMARLGELVKAASGADQVRVKDLIWDPKGRYVNIRI